MAAVIDSGVWIDFTRERSPEALKRMIAPHVLSPEAALAEPVVYEVLRHATEREARLIEEQFQTLPLLATPPDLWTRAARLGQSCRKKGVTAGSLDLLICAVAVHHGADLITFDAAFQEIGAVCALRVKLLQRPGA